LLVVVDCGERKRKADLISIFGNIDGLPRLLVDSLTKEIKMKGIYLFKDDG
jgi:hypothetical protein